MPERIDVIWDALEAEFGVVRTKSERGRRNSAVKELRDAGATVEEIKIAADYCRRNFTYFTEKALCLWLSKALEEQKQNGLSRDTFLRLVKRDRTS
jgi:hypothetical protein